MMKIIDFWADWCYPCKALSKVLDQVVSDVDVDIVKVNIDEHPDLVERYQIHAVPTLVFEKDGVEVSRLLGAKNKDTLMKEIWRVFF